jgi:S-adenosylmethionine:tRNA ribosyltransferase-isomerase
MRLSDFDFDLPEANIALRPAEPRETARLLVVSAGNDAPFEDATIRAFLRHLSPKDIVVFNDTRVIPAQLSACRVRDGAAAKVEIMLHKRVAPDQWLVMAKPGKKLRKDDSIVFQGNSALVATVADKSEDGDILLLFNRAGADLDAEIAITGRVPLPPYIAQKRAVDSRDLTDYQTIYAREDGAVAAPTAGLHFTKSLMSDLHEIGVQTAHVTLHVGAGTFLPVKTDDVHAHRMHAETGTVTPEVAERINRVKAAGGRVVAVGTTALRLLESAATPEGVLQPFAGDTAIFITPGYRFRMVGLLFTNFHLPKSTLFMLVSAFAGQARMRAAYEHAIRTGYRFYSYGDASLLYRAGHDS